MLLEKDGVGDKEAKDLEPIEIKRRKGINMATLKKRIKLILPKDEREHCFTTLSREFRECH